MAIFASYVIGQSDGRCNDPAVSASTHAFLWGPLNRYILGRHHQFMT